MTDLTMEETYELITGLDDNKVKAFVEWYKEKKESCESFSETDHEYYYDLYDPLGSFSYTNYDEDEEEICNGKNFFERCMHWSDGTPEHFIEFAKIVDETGF